jgi:hypothetical protein
MDVGERFFWWRLYPSPFVGLPKHFVRLSMTSEIKVFWVRRLR